jgi:cell envelope opacity-associated protein A
MQALQQAGLVEAVPGVETCLHPVWQPMSCSDGVSAAAASTSAQAPTAGATALAPQLETAPALRLSPSPTTAPVAKQEQEAANEPEAKPEITPEQKQDAAESKKDAVVAFDNDGNPVTQKIWRTSLPERKYPIKPDQA